MDKARRVYERRLGRIVGAFTSLGSVGVVGAVAAARHHYAIDLSYADVTLLFGAAMALGPVAGRLSRSFARRRLARQIEAQVQQHPEVPAGLIERFVATERARALEEASVSWPLAHRATLGVVGWLWALGFVSVSGLDIIGKALGFAMANGALSIIAVAGAGYLGGQRLVGRKRSRSWARTAASLGALATAFAVGLERLFSANEEALAAVVYFTIGGIAVMLPSVWKAGQRLRIERASLATHALLTPAADVEDENARLARTIAWVEGPPEVRAEALRALVHRIPSSERGPHLERGLDSQNIQLRRTALELSHKLRHAPSLERLIALAEDAGLPPEDAALLPALLHRHRAPEVPAALTRLLGHGADSVREAAALSLGLVGSAPTVAALREAGRSGGRLAEVCQEAIERIQIRLAQSPGQLSLVEVPEGGALSPADEGGSLTFTS